MISALKSKIESILYARDNPPEPFLAALLQGISFLYGTVQRVRTFCYRRRVFKSHELPCKVISVGNITVGGTGKTPMTVHVAEMIKGAGISVAIVSRGYRGSAEKHGGIVSDGCQVYMDAKQAGDEPYMIACRLKGIPVIVGKDRLAAGMLAIREFQPDVIVLDDAFQHLRLKRDIDLVLLDHLHPLGNSHLLPRGILREPVSSLARSTACVLTRCRRSADAAPTASAAVIQRLAPDVPLFTSSHVPYWHVIPEGRQLSFEVVRTDAPAPRFEPQKLGTVFCFSGIARNDEFRRTVKNLGFKITGSLEFSDHHPYTKAELAAIIRRAIDSGADRLITTEKDHARLASNKPLPLGLIIVGVKVSFGGSQRGFSRFIHNRLNLVGADQSSAVK